MNVIQTDLSEVLLVEPDVFEDARGFFFESWQRRKFADIGIDCDFVQDNHSRSIRGTLRGLHYQLRRSQGKLVRATAGEVFDVAVDIRRGSPTFGRWTGRWLSAENKRMLWIPPGFAHGFYVSSDVAEFQYKCTEYYDPEQERCIWWRDPAIGIEWPLVGEPLVSDKDARGVILGEAEIL